MTVLISWIKFLTYTGYWAAADIAQYSAMVLNKNVYGCLVEARETIDPLRMHIIPVTHFLGVLLVAKLASNTIVGLNSCCYW